MAERKIVTRAKPTATTKNMNMGRYSINIKQLPSLKGFTPGKKWRLPRGQIVNGSPEPGIQEKGPKWRRVPIRKNIHYLDYRKEIVLSSFFTGHNMI
jgi:hypothetical protein